MTKRWTRRELITAAAAMGATVAWGGAKAKPSRTRWTERREHFAQGVASGDPAPESVLLWTRASAAGSAAAVALTVEVAEDAAFERVVATAPVRAPAAASAARAPLPGTTTRGRCASPSSAARTCARGRRTPTAG